MIDNIVRDKLYSIRPFEEVEGQPIPWSWILSNPNLRRSTYRTVYEELRSTNYKLRNYYILHQYTDERVMNSQAPHVYYDSIEQGNMWFDVHGNVVDTNKVKNDIESILNALVEVDNNVTRYIQLSSNTDYLADTILCCYNVNIASDIEYIDCSNIDVNRINQARRIVDEIGKVTFVHDDVIFILLDTRWIKPEAFSQICGMFDDDRLYSTEGLRLIGYQGTIPENIVGYRLTTMKEINMVRAMYKMLATNGQNGISLFGGIEALNQILFSGE